MPRRIPRAAIRKVLWCACAGLIAVGALLVGRTTFAGGSETARASEAPDAGEAPDAAQPATASQAGSVPFDHVPHAGDYQMACQYCHVYADKSTVAGLPSLRLCMGCHKFVDKQKPGVKELARLWQAKQPPRWRLVYELPDYVYFSHRVHVAAKVECSRCHGDVASMHEVRRVASLTMGWCLSCHREQHAALDCVACHK